MPEVDLYDRTEFKDAVALVVKSVEDCERRYHDRFVEKVEKRYAAYRALSEELPPDANGEEDWHSNITTP